MSSARAVRCRVKSHNERNPYRQLPAAEAGHSVETATVRCEEGGDDVKSARPLHPGRHTCYNGRYRGQPRGDPERISKAGRSSDWSLQPDSTKLDSLVIAHQPWRGEYVPGRNKVAVPEGAAGTPPFWSRSSCGSLPPVHYQRDSLEGSFKTRLVALVPALNFRFKDFRF